MRHKRTAEIARAGIDGAPSRVCFAQRKYPILAHRGSHRRSAVGYYQLRPAAHIDVDIIIIVSSYMGRGVSRTGYIDAGHGKRPGHLIAGHVDVPIIERCRVVGGRQIVPLRLIGLSSGRLAQVVAI